ncbi:MAG: hypothetical protein RLZ97_501 [Verrucomicrobiota bacterium]|jgi:hypothetical protein
MKLTSVLSCSVLSAVLVASCVPYPDDQPVPPADVAQNNPAADAQKTAEQKAKEEAERKKKEAEAGGSQAGNTKPTITERPPEPEPPKPDPKPQIPVARSVPGKPGFVFSPFNNKIIDVKDYPSGTLVADPTYPPADKKYFRVP